VIGFDEDDDETETFQIKKEVNSIVRCLHLRSVVLGDGHASIRTETWAHDYGIAEIERQSI